VNASGKGIQDLAGNPISGGFTGGEVYSVMRLYLIYLPLVLR